MTGARRAKNPGGRRPGDSRTREAILHAARSQFAERGYDGASLRAIAAAAGVDPALIRHFYTDKATLFTVSIADNAAVTDRMAAAVAGDAADIGRRVTDVYLGLWEDDDTRPTLEALLRSAVVSPTAARTLAGLMLGRLPAPDDGTRDRRLALAMAHLVGVAFGRYVVGVPQLAAMSHEDLVAEVAPAIQRYLAEHRT